MSGCNKDIFHDLAKMLGCEFISDLRYSPWKTEARERICRLNLEQYSPEQLEDMAEYLYEEKVRLESIEQAKAFFRRKWISQAWVKLKRWFRE